jgi:hypothetical protein
VDKNISNQNIIKDNSKDTKLDKNIGDSKSDTIDTTKNDDLIKESNKSTKTNDFVPTNNTKRIINISEINAVRINNTFATADKKLLKNELELFQKLRDYSFDSEIGYLVNSILDSNVRVVGSNNLILSYDTDALVRQNLDNILQLNEIYNKITSSHKNIAIVSDMEWNQLKDEYIQKIKNKEQYIIQKEPDVILEETKKNDIIVDSAISLFGEDVVEVE